MNPSRYRPLSEGHTLTFPNSFDTSLLHKLMKFRTFLMFVCMIIVPMIAMFSHKVPTAMRTACGEVLIAPINYFAEIIFFPSVASSTDQEIAGFDDHSQCSTFSSSSISISQIIKILQLNQLYHTSLSTPPQWRHLRLHTGIN